MFCRENVRVLLIIQTVIFSYWLSLGNPTVFYSWAILKAQSKDIYWLQATLLMSNTAAKNGLNLVQMGENMCCHRELITLSTYKIS